MVRRREKWRKKMGRKRKRGRGGRWGGRRGKGGGGRKLKTGTSWV